MEKYVVQLLEELEKLKGNKPEKPNVHILYPDHPALDYGLDYIAEWECAPLVSMSELLGFAQDNLPVVEKLTEKQAAVISDKILDVWQEFNFYADFPDGLPELTKYKILRKRWGEDVQYVSEGMMHFEFCDYEPENCPFGIEYCSCKDIDSYDMDDLNPLQEGELPF